MHIQTISSIFFLHKRTDIDSCVVTSAKLKLNYKNIFVRTFYLSLEEMCMFLPAQNFSFDVVNFLILYWNALKNCET